MGAPHTEVQVAAILNAAWLVRHYARGGRSTLQSQQRSRAIRQLGIIVRESFSLSDDFEPLLAAVVDGLRPKDEPPF